jgi:aspartyl-tRNA(Asn)/glutamyl-tRNA(Gln) amidotransferase subunit C
MKIEDLKETAALAHLNLSEKELAGAFPAFEQMLGYFAAMEAAPVVWMAADRDEAGGIALGGNSAVSRTVSSNHFRPDNLNSNNTPNNLNENLLNNAGERDGRFVVVPNVL